MSRPSFWLRSYRPRTGNPLLVCLPHAGGSAAFYRDWARLLSPAVDMVSVQYPGRLDRITEPCITEMDTMADTLAAVLADELPEPFAVFGHSMGAAIAHEAAMRLERTFNRRILHLFVSGRPAPQHHRQGILHLATDEQLWQHVRGLGGTPDELLDHPPILASATPSLRGDYQLMETYAPGDLSPLSCPVTAVIGAEDPEVTVGQVCSWADLTRCRFDLQTQPGDHFYLVADPDSVTGLIRQQLEWSAAGGGPAGPARPKETAGGAL